MIVPSSQIFQSGEGEMGSERKLCAICAWRVNCQKRFCVAMDAHGNVHCADYSRDLSIKEEDIDKAVKKDAER